MGKYTRKYGIVGIGETKVGKVPNSTPMSLALEAGKKAIEDAGLTNKDIDGLLSQQPYLCPTLMFTSGIGQNMGLELSYCVDLNIGGATPISMVNHAIMAMEAGLCSSVLCIFSENQLTAMKARPRGMMFIGNEDFDLPQGQMFAPPAYYAMAARRHMYEYGTRSEQFGAIAVAMRKHALLNENSQMNKPITLEDHQNSRLSVEPFRLLDICLVSDGAGAVVVTSTERARNLRQDGVYILGFGEGHIPRASKFLLNADNMTTFGGRIAGRKAYEMAGIGPKDIDIAEIYDCFTYNVLVQIEDYGFCEKGEGGPFVEGGRIELG
ncbi:MAG: thiolase family protein, partial [Thermodesulfobacteriota bacterium]|nr:thiolase family protein [Thermodesulfobacteriota bacterium]